MCVCDALGALELETQYAIHNEPMLRNLPHLHIHEMTKEVKRYIPT
jgi:hypothetical protein